MINSARTQKGYPLYDSTCRNANNNIRGPGFRIVAEEQPIHRHRQRDKSLVVKGRTANGAKGCNDHIFHYLGVIHTGHVVQQAHHVTKAAAPPYGEQRSSSPATSLDNARAAPREHEGTPVPGISLGVEINLIKNVICPSLPGSSARKVVWH